MHISKIKSTVVQACMVNDLKPFKKILMTDQIEIQGSDKEKFFLSFEKMLNTAHKKGKGDWRMETEKADWLKNRSALAHDFYDSKSNQPLICVVIEEKTESLWMEVLRG